MAGEEIQIRQDTRTVEQIVDSMSLFDDDLMSMVFITQTDIFGHGIPIYTINRHFKEEGGRGKMCEAVEKYAEQRAEIAGCYFKFSMGMKILIELLL